MKSIEVFFPTLILSFMYAAKFEIESFVPAASTRLDDKETDYKLA